MSLRILLIGGTGAPKRSQFYYQPLLDVAKQYSESVDFEAILFEGGTFWWQAGVQTTVV